MSRTVEFEYRGKQAVFISTDYAKKLKEKGVDLNNLKRNLDDIWWTVHHTDSDWTKPSWVKPGIGMVNRMGFIAGPDDLFLKSDPKVSGFNEAIFTNKKEEKAAMKMLFKIAYDAEGAEGE